MAVESPGLRALLLRLRQGRGPHLPVLRLGWLRRFDRSARAFGRGQAAGSVLVLPPLAASRGAAGRRRKEEGRKEVIVEEEEEARATRWSCRVVCSLFQDEGGSGHTARPPPDRPPPIARGLQSPRACRGGGPAGAARLHPFLRALNATLATNNTEAPSRGVFGWHLNSVRQYGLKGWGGGDQDRRRRRARRLTYHNGGCGPGSSSSCCCCRVFSSHGWAFCLCPSLF